MSTDAPTPIEHTSEQAIALLAKNADMIEQTASNLEKSLAHLSDGQKLKLREYEVKEDQRGYGYSLKRKGATLTVYNDHNQQERDQYKLHYEGLKRADTEFAQLISDLSEVGVLTHKVHLDNKVLTTHESFVLEHLPSKLEEARAALQEVVDHAGSVDGAKMAEMTQYKRDVKFIEGLQKELGNAGEVLARHNGELIDRQSELRTEEEIDADRMAKFKKGVALLDESSAHAKKYNPAYRERIKHRKEHPELKVLEDVPEATR